MLFIGWVINWWLSNEILTKDMCENVYNIQVEKVGSLTAVLPKKNNEYGDFTEDIFALIFTVPHTNSAVRYLSLKLIDTIITSTFKLAL